MLQASARRGNTAGADQRMRWPMGIRSGGTRVSAASCVSCPRARTHVNAFRFHREDKYTFLCNATLFDVLLLATVQTKRFMRRVPSYRKGSCAMRRLTDAYMRYMSGVWNATVR